MTKHTPSDAELNSLQDGVIGFVLSCREIRLRKGRIIMRHPVQNIKPNSVRVLSSRNAFIKSTQTVKLQIHKFTKQALTSVHAMLAQEQISI